MEMQEYNLVPRVKRSIESAIELANKYKHEQVNCSHLLCCLLDEATPAVKVIFNSFSINVENLKKALLLELPDSNPTYFKASKKNEWWSKDIESILKDSFDMSHDLDHQFIGIEHLLYSILKSDSETKKFLCEKGAPCEEIADGIISILNPFENQDSVEKEKAEPQEQKKEKYISKYCQNLNELVLKFNSKIEGRDLEINKLIEIISCKVKNNAILIGDAGVGKTAIVEGLAQAINLGDCPVFLSGSKIYSLDLGLMLAGTKYRGQFEERLKGLIEEFKNDSQAILFIDEIHSIIGAGSNEGSADLANMIKPALARGELKCIGATTAEEYKKYFEKDSALNRRFQTINVDEPSKKDTFLILKKAKQNYEVFHGVTYSDEIINDILNLSEKYMPYRKFPDKAFDILDRIGASGKIKKFVVPDNLKILEKNIIKYMEDSVLNKKDNKEKCEKMLKSFLKKREKWLTDTDNNLFEIQHSDIKDVISNISGLKKENIELNSAKSILTLNEEIKSKIFDQTEVIDKIYEILICSKAGIKKRNKTVANFLFVGATGVGKTYTAKVIAEKFFNKPNSFLQIDMGEFVEKNSISKLLGASAGYVGYEEGGLLSEFVRANPSSLILFDEVEKAHPEMTNILLRIMDEGCIIDNFNRKIDFSNCIIVLTGNIGAETETARAMGFSDASSTNSKRHDYEKAIKQQFKPELVSRLDEILIFNSQFSEQGLSKMIDSNICEIENSLMEKKIKLIKNEELQSFLFACIKKEGNNARSVQKILRSKFEIPLSKFIVSNENIEEINAKIVDNDIVFM
jgi:ATP-dependent Clp protease ATP-binding subunit ClpC